MAAASSSSSAGPASAEELLLKEAEKLERISKELRRLAVTARRVKRNSSAAALDKALVELDGLISGVEAMVRALERKYPNAAAEAAEGRGTYGTNVFRESMQLARTTIADSKKISHECKRGTMDSSANGDDDTATSRNQQQQQQQQLLLARRSTLADDKLVELSDEEIQGITTNHMRELAEEARAIRGAAEHLNTLTHEQALKLEQAETNVNSAEQRTEAGRLNLSQAAKYKMTAMTLTAALVGGLVGGPIGAIAGAKSAAGIIACAAAGGATSVVVTKQVTNKVQERLAEEQRVILNNPAAAARESRAIQDRDNREE
jgi:hypothetical protein